MTSTLPTANDAHWRLATRLAFRLVFSYMLIYIFPFPLGVLPYTAYPSEKWDQLCNKVVPWY